MIFSLSLALAIAVFVNADDDGYICNGTTIFDPPDDISQPTYYPTGWTEKLFPPNFAPNQKCMWKVNIPQGMYAQVAFYKVTDEGKDIFVEYPNSKIERIANDDNQPYYFVSPFAAFIMYQSDMIGAFAFKIFWVKYPLADKKTLQVVQGGYPIALVPDSDYTTFQAETRVSLTGFSIKDPKEQYLLRRSAVYAGGSTDGEFIGTIEHVLMSSNQVVTVNDKLTIFTFDLDKFIDYPMFMAHDYSNVKNLNTIRGFNCPDTGDCSVEVNSRFGPSAAVSVGDTSDFIKSFDYIFENSTLNIYEANIVDKNRITSLTKSSSTMNLPTKINNYMKFYVLDEGRAVMKFSKSAEDAKWGKVFDGRKAFVHSYNFGFRSSVQDSQEVFTTYDQEQINFNWTVKNIDLSTPHSVLIVKVLSNFTEVFSSAYVDGKYPPKIPTIINGDTLQVIYKTGGDQTGGFWMDFETSKQLNSDTSTTVLPPTTSKTTVSTLSTSSTTLKTSSTTPSQTSRNTPSTMGTAISHVETTTSDASKFNYFITFAIGFILFRI